MNSSSLFEMEMERLDSEIEKTNRQFNRAVLGKKREIKRTWLEISAMTNAHILQMLPYKAMLGHVAKLADERDQVIAEMLASKARIQEQEEEDRLEITQDDLDLEEDDSLEHNNNTPPPESPTSISISNQTSNISTPSEYDYNNVKARDEAVQTEESSFNKEG